ncbi:MAG: type pilus biosis protein [Polaromonas sp.]|nr:type pilus biosis protein [Polaromonas sp.]
MLALTRLYSAKRHGFTLIELMVVLALIAIIAALAAPDFQRTIARQQLNAAASDLLTSAMQARSEAIKNNRQVIVQPVSADSDWSKGWRIYVDMDNSRTYTESDVLVTTVAATTSTIEQYETPTLNPNLIGFDSTGFALGSNAGRVVFSSRILGGNYLKGVVIARTGRARTCTTQPGANNCTGAN